ncbi:Ap3d1 [Symbiodinium pilosum]|uniref:Ap3d1 protein n=1 Tax=Symbiodinium pilosum TaxID=2952 RepID=A0A812XNZ6_SYMPI|nr:Ap3d1 [Symbiodinium pilosum]
MVFEKSLTAMVKGIRAHRGKESEYINSCIAEIKNEVTSKNMATKSMAVLKLAYLNMLGYDMGWATFAVVEVMSTNRFATKRPGYLASSIAFTEQTDVGLLTINLFKKDFGSQSEYQTGMAISCLSNICSPEISKDIITDLLSLLSSSRAYLRKKTVLCLYRIFLKDPPALRTCFPKLKDRLTDEDQGVLTATVNTFLELARKNARNYLSLVPQLYHVLVNTSNNWLSIKLLKVFQLLSPLEPRLPAKLVEPLTNILNTTKAQSVEFEAIRCVVRSMPEGTAIVALAIEKLQAFLNSSDRNLRYLALDLFREVIEKFKEKAPVSDLHDKVLTSIEESDVTARHIALQLLDKIVHPSNFQEAVQRLLEFSRKAMPNDEFLGTILRMGSRDRYALVEDFAWYLLILGEISRNLDSSHAETVAEQFVDICVRVPQVRPYAVTLALSLLDAPSAGDGAEGADKASPVSSAMIGACAWTLGEYCGDLEKPAEASFLSGARCLLASKGIQALDAYIQTRCVWAATKLYINAPHHAPDAVSQLHEMLNASLPAFVRSTHVDVSERSSLVLHMASFFKADGDRIADANTVLSEPLLPVKADAQAQVQPAIDLDEPFFAKEEAQPSFLPVRADPTDPYSLASTYKDDLGILAAQEPAKSVTGPPSQASQSSIFYLGQSKEQVPAEGTEQAEPAPDAQAKDPLAQMRERLEAQRTSSASAPKYQVMREEVSVPGGLTNSIGQVPSSSSSANALPTPPEKELTELHGRLWTCHRGRHIAVYACVRSHNLRKQQLRIDLRCERTDVDSSQVVSDVMMSFPSAVTLLEVQAPGLVLVQGPLQQRSAKVKALVSTTNFRSPGVVALRCEVDYSLASESEEAKQEKEPFELQLPATTFLVPQPLSEDDISEYMSQHAAELLNHKAVQAVSFASAGQLDVSMLVGRCAGLCHLAGIRQAVPQSQDLKFILAGTCLPSTDVPVEGQPPPNAKIICMCVAMVRESNLELKVTVKAYRQEVADEIGLHIANTFRELVEGRLREM